jgi:hypothetical protein
VEPPLVSAAIRFTSWSSLASDEQATFFGTSSFFPFFFGFHSPPILSLASFFLFSHHLHVSDPVVILHSYATAAILVFLVVVVVVVVVAAVSIPVASPVAVAIAVTISSFLLGVLIITLHLFTKF